MKILLDTHIYNLFMKKTSLFYCKIYIKNDKLNDKDEPIF